MKRQRLGSPPIQAPPPLRPDQVAAGSSRSGFDSSYPSPPSHLHPQVPAVPESSNSLQAYAADKVLYIQMALTCSWYTSSLCVHAVMLVVVSVHVFVPSVEWSDGGAVWGVPAAIFRFGPEGDVPNSAAARHTARLCRCVWNTQSRSALTFCCDPYSLSVFLAVARLYLTGSSMNGLGCRSSDADLCLVLKGNVSISDTALWMSFRMCVCVFTIIETHFLLNTCMFFCCRKDLILFVYSLPSKGCSDHCVSNNKPLFWIWNHLE